MNGHSNGDQNTERGESMLISNNLKQLESVPQHTKKTEKPVLGQKPSPSIPLQGTIHFR
jgi:hypothetical protein